ncbi:hypothetical protein FKB34_06885 [Glycocaulis profundi]|nr:hypothetical protein FKB34_06885 [Glycocaulis profundi]
MRAFIAAAALSVLVPAAVSAEPVEVGIEESHPNGMSVLIRSLELTDTEVRLDVRVINGHTENIRLAGMSDWTFVQTEGGDRLRLVAPPDNRELNIARQSTVDGSLVFMGSVPESGDLTLVLNDRGDDNPSTPNPRFEITLPSDTVEAAALKKN